MGVGRQKGLLHVKMVTFTFWYLRLRPRGAMPDFLPRTVTVQAGLPGQPLSLMQSSVLQPGEVRCPLPLIPSTSSACSISLFPDPIHPCFCKLFGLIVSLVTLDFQEISLGGLICFSVCPFWTQTSDRGRIIWNLSAKGPAKHCGSGFRSGETARRCLPERAQLVSTIFL